MLCRCPRRVQTASNGKVILISRILQVHTELNDSVVGIGGLDFFWVMGDDEGLGGLVGDDAFLTLKVLSGLRGFFFFAEIFAMLPSLP